MIDQVIFDLLKVDLFDIYYQYLIEENQKLNLTAITEKADVYLKHFYDSLMITKTLHFEDKKVLDIGAGAGFPSMPIKMIYPSMDLTIVDGLNKRIDFLKRLIGKLDVEATLVHGRAEEIDQKNTFDIVLARAVAKLNMLVEMALPLLKKDGVFVAFKSIHYEDELKEAKSAIYLMGGKVEDIIEYDIDDDIKHVYILIRKIKNSPKGYPRPYAKIKKKPL